MFWKRRKMGQGGQSAVETALVMPMNVFIILAIIQNGLIAQARIMAKYAAYRAVRVGVMNNARVDMMTNAALVTLLPVMAFPTGASNTGTFRNMQDTGQAATQLAEAIAANKIFGGTFIQPVAVAICSPTTSMIGNVKASSFAQSGVTGSGNEIDFDDPRAATEWTNDITSSISSSGFNAFMQTKLAIQVQFKYPMIIPFANMIISMAYLGQDLPEVMRMQTSTSPIPTTSTASLSTLQFAQLWGLAQHQIYLAPINASYAMRMQSDIYLQAGGNATLQSQNNCFHYTPQGS
jgi:hypothetical protein